MADVAVVYGGPTPEHDVSVLTGLQAVRALERDGIRPLSLYWTKSGDWHSVPPDLEAAAFVEGVPPKSRRLELTAAPGGGFFAAASGFLGKRERLDVDVVVNCCHGGPGEDGTLQAAFDLAGLRYTGPDVAGAAIGMDKVAFGAAVAAAALPSLPRYLVDRDDATPPAFDPPYIVKPRFGGSSIGIDIVEDFDTAVALARTSPLMRQGAIVERYLPDARDLNIAIRTYPELQLSAIEAPARSAEDSSILTYSEKYLAWQGLGGHERELPANIPAALAERIRAAARTVARIASVRSVARLDFLCRDGELWVNEINTIPGALAWYLWVDPKLTLGRLLLDMIAEARSRPARQFAVSGAGADGSALRAAGSIASKLV